MPRRCAVPHRALVLSSAVALAVGGFGFVGSPDAAAQPGGGQGGPPSGAGGGGARPPRVNIRPNPGNDQGQANRERARQASGEVEAAQAALRQAQTKVRETFEASPEFVEAKRAAAEAQQAYDAAVRPVLETARASPEYQRLEKALEDAQAQLAAASGAPAPAKPARPAAGAAGKPGGGSSAAAAGGVVGPSAASTRRASAGPGEAPAVTDPNAPPPIPGTVTEAAKQLMEHRSALRKLEEDAIAADPAAAEAKARRDETAKALADLRQGIDARIQNDPEYAAAKKQLDDARASAAAGGR
jgi:hypothetical protein